MGELWLTRLTTSGFTSTEQGSESMAICVGVIRAIGKVYESTPIRVCQRNDYIDNIYRNDCIKAYIDKYPHRAFPLLVFRWSIGLAINFCKGLLEFPPTDNHIV